MAYFVTVTFDLEGAESSAYKKIQAALEELDFSKFAVGNKKVEIKLPNNTFIAKFDVDQFERKSEVTAWVSEKIKEIADEISVSGNFFVTVGKGWAWKIGGF